MIRVKSDSSILIAIAHIVLVGDITGPNEKGNCTFEILTDSIYDACISVSSNLEELVSLREEVIKYLVEFNFQRKFVIIKGLKLVVIDDPISKLMEEYIPVAMAWMKKNTQGLGDDLDEGFVPGSTVGVGG